MRTDRTVVLVSALLCLFVAPGLLAAPCPESDGDGWADCELAGCDPVGLACGDRDDTSFDVNPGATETCDHRDDECDGAVDEGFATATTCECHHDLFPNGYDRLGFSVTGLGDIDGDGVPDIAVGAPFDDLTGWDTGVVTLYSGVDRRILWRTASTQSFLYLGNAIEPIADMHGDGLPDLLSGSPVTDSVVVISGAGGGGIARCVEPAGGGDVSAGRDGVIVPRRVARDPAATLESGTRRPRRGRSPTQALRPACVLGVSTRRPSHACRGRTRTRPAP